MPGEVHEGTAYEEFHHYVRCPEVHKPEQKTDYHLGRSFLWGTWACVLTVIVYGLRALCQGLMGLK